ncbi:bile acid:sodium symporter [Roseomonas sp. OT10]|uniref:bile acid:sodium symporter family protein n=1 Tax=Roseomonas cutis TaxID=2897332 RepID=UPI001E638531|nr:bile acid:sodium symporter family protein [Roseomonas sp. OT10]UFN47340.1 bile acid:sodium symporter [Roseomonas sp. OT10]
MSLATLRSRLRIDPYLLALLATVAVAALLPARGVGAEVLDVAVSVAVAGLFFLYGARLAPQAVLAGLAHWRLQGLVAGSTYLLFPALGLLAGALLRPWVAPELAAGLLFVCLLPSTVQSSIAFTSIARGNVPAALCSASVSNLLGVVLTPLLVALLLGAQGGFSLEALENIALQLLLPFALGQAVRPWIGAWLTRHKPITSVFDRGSILLVVYAAFSEGMVAGIWSRISLGGLGLILLADAVILALVLAVTTLVSRRAGFSTEDEIALVFCGSKKSLASGIPMANILFPASAVGLAVLPLMLFHQLQLFACAALARRYARRAEPAPAPDGALAIG